MSVDHSSGRPVPTAAPDFLTGGGEMGRVIAAKDWSQTLLGPIELWPQSLRTTVSLCLASNFPISIAWGEHRTQIYNDGYWPICGAKHPYSMGQDFRECWALAWPAIGKAFQSAERGEARFLENQRMFLDRNGYLEETFFTFSFSPIRDESGGVGGLFHPVTETTAKMLSERRTQTLRDLAARTTNASTLEEACASAVAILGENDLDLPFALLYLLDQVGEEVYLVGSSGIKQGGQASPATIRLMESEEAWPMWQAFNATKPQLVENFAQRLDLAACGPYPEVPSKAFVLPIQRPGHSRSAGVLVAGVSSRLPLDEAYRGFYDLVARQLATAIANARAYEEERRRADALAELDRAKTQFFSNVSHEFRTPLTLMLGPLEEWLARESDSITARRDEVNLIYRNELRLLRLVNALLDFSRLEAGRERALFEPVDLASLTGDYASSFRSATEKAGLQFVVDCPIISEPVYIDRLLWEKVVLNLISNAFKFTLEGSILVTLRESDSFVELAVSDTGTGIPEGALGNLFDRFYRVEGTRGRSHEGTGIGLSLVQEVVKLHGGTVRVESEFGHGSTFRVWVPKGSAHLPPDQVANRDLGFRRMLSGASGNAFVDEASHWIHNQPAYSRQEGGKCASASEVVKRPRILLADDNSDMREYIQRLLEEDYDVEAVPNGAKALERAHEDRPDLVLSDIMMPELDGFGLLAALRKDERTQGIPVVLLSARAGEEARVEGLQAGADDYLVKPFRAKELLARVRTNVELAQLRARLTREEERRTSLAAMERQWRLFDTALSHTPDFTYLFDLDGRFSYANRALLDLWQKSLEDAVGKNFSDLGYPPELAQRHQNEIQRVITTKEPLKDHTPFTGPTGETRYYEYIYVPVLTEAGIVEAVTGSTRDITDRRQAELALRQSEQRLARALEAGELGAWELDMVTHTAWRSLQHDQIFEYETLLPEWTLEMFLDHVLPEDRANAAESFRCAIAEGRTWELDCRIKRADGVERWIWAQGKSEFDETGHPIRMKGMVRDITARKLSEEELRRSNEELAHTNRQLEEFAYAASHDLQEPLRMVNVFAQQLVRRFANGDEDAKQYARYVRQGVTRMQDLIRDLLQFSRAVHIDGTPATGMADLSASLHDALSVVENPIEESGAIITADTLPSVRGDQAQLSLVFQNLLSNALKYRRSDEAPQIHVSAVSERGDCVVSIRDNGIGFDQQYAERIFGLFKRLHNDAYPGTSVGLAICKRIVERYGGWMWAEGSPGRGATFYFTLPTIESQ